MCKCVCARVGMCVGMFVCVYLHVGGHVGVCIYLCTSMMKVLPGNFRIADFELDTREHMELRAKINISSPSGKSRSGSLAGEQNAPT